MSKEFTVSNSLAVKNGNLVYSVSTSFRPNQTTANGPSPGAVSVTTSGVDIPLAQLATPGLARIKNLNATNYVTIGLWDSTTFFPLLELLPGEEYVMRLSRAALTGQTIRAVAHVATCIIQFDAFDA